MGKVLQSDFRTTIEVFRAFIDDRPDDEKWELIDGEIVLNPTANNRHQIIVTNVLLNWNRSAVARSLPGRPSQASAPAALTTITTSQFRM